MKWKVIFAISCLFLVGSGLLFYLKATYLANPRFGVSNTTARPVQVTAYWRDEIKSIGTIAPNQKVEFTVKDEATISFKAKFEDGTEMTSEAWYFTAGISIMAKITESAIELRYELSTKYQL